MGCGAIWYWQEDRGMKMKSRKYILAPIFLPIPGLREPGWTKQVYLYRQKHRTQKDTSLIFLRSIFLPYQRFYYALMAPPKNGNHDWHSTDVIGFHPVRIQACSRRLSECDTSGWI